MEKKILKIIEDQNKLLQKLLELNIEKKGKHVKKNEKKIEDTKVTKEPKLRIIKKNLHSKNMIKKIINYGDLNSNLLKIVKNKPILICSTQYPGYGGGATNSYNIHKFLNAMGFTNVLCVFFVHEKFYTMEGFNYNPDNISNTICFNRKNIDDTDVKKTILEKLNVKTEKDIIMSMCKNTWSCIYINKIFPSVNLVYLVSGSAHITTYVSNKSSVCYEDIKNNTEIMGQLLEKKNEKEVQIFKDTRYVCCNSLNSSTITKKVYCNFTNIYDLYTSYLTVFVNSFTMKFDYTNYNNRFFDLIYVVSNFERNIKGIYIAKKILKKIEETSKRKLNICIIGNNNHLLETTPNDFVNYYTYDCKKNSDVLNYMHNSKVLIIPSLYEACPNTMHEAIVSGCSVIVSKNVGSYEVLPSSNIVNDYHNVDEWVKKILDCTKLKEKSPELEYCDVITTDMLKLIYECNMNNCITHLDSYANRLYIDYDFLKMFGVNTIEQFLKMGYRIILPKYVLNLYTSSIEVKYIKQRDKLLHSTYELVDKYKSQIECFSKDDMLKFIKEQKNNCVFTNVSADKISKYFVGSPVTDKVSELHNFDERNLTINICYPNNNIKDLVNFVTSINDKFSSVLIISSLTKNI